MKKALTLLLVFLLSLSVFVACDFGQKPEQEQQQGGETKPPVVDEDLQAAYDYIKLTYKTLGTTATNFEVMKNAPVGEKMFAITWTTNNEAITITETEDGKFYVVNVPALGEASIAYTLNFSIQNDKGEKKEGSFNLTVPAYQVNTFDEYAAAEDGTSLTVQGIVTGVISKSTNSTKENSLFLQDLNNNGGYYIYNLAEDPAGTISVGMTVEVKGEKKNYNGTFELVNPVVTVIDQTIKTVTPVDYTEIFAAAASTDAAELIAKQGMLVSINGVTLLNYTESDGYHNFKLGNNKSYLRVSSSSNCITKAEGETVTETFNANFYNSATVTGIIAVFNGGFYLMPVSSAPFTGFVEQEKPADVKINIALENTKIPSIIQVAGDTALPTTFSSFSDVSIAWELVVGETAGCATLNGSTLSVTIPEAAETITLKATATCGNVSSDPKEYTVTVKGIDTITVKDADNIAADFVKNQYTEEVFYITGTIQQISNDIYGNMYIAAIIDGGEYGIDIYGLNDVDGKKYSDFTGYKPQVGDTITVLTVVGKYNNTQLKNAVLVSYAHNYVATVTAPTCSAQGYTTYTCKCGDTYVDNYTDKGACNYGDDDVCDTCGVKNHTHTTVATDVVVAPTCIAEGYTVYKCSDEACAYTENKDATEKVACADANGDFKCDTEGCDELVLPAADSTLTIEQALAIGVLTTTTNKYYITGTITEVYNTTYGNMYLTDGTNTITIYGTYSADGELRYDALTGTKPAANDVVTVYGILTSYNGNAQMKNGWIQHSYNEVVTAPDCKNEGYTTYTCKYCGYSYVGNKIAAGECSFDENGVCTGCGALNHEHVWDNGEVTAATCLADGYTTYKCTDDNCTKTKVEDVVTALGHEDTDGDYKCDNGTCDELVLPEAGSTLTIAEALAIGALYKNDTGASYAKNWYYITGWITALSSTKYGTCVITDGTDSISVYGLKDSTGSNRYEYLDVKPVVGDTVKIYGQVGAYKTDVQMNNSNIIEHTVHSECTDFTAATCNKLAKCVLCGKTTGDYADHTMVNGVCSVCGQKEGAVEKTPVTVSKSHNDIATIAGVTAGQNTGKIDGVSIALNEDITIKCDKNTAGTVPTIFSESIRLYQNGALLTITAAEGCEMTTIVLTLANNAAGDGPIEVTGGTADNASAPTNYVYTITVDSGVSEVVIKAVGTDKNSRLYVANIEVNYKK